ncbi:MAG: hypothetical protein ACYDA9_14900 [Terriglobia bacterium]
MRLRTADSPRKPSPPTDTANFIFPAGQDEKTEIWVNIQGGKAGHPMEHHHEGPFIHP